MAIDYFGQSVTDCEDFEDATLQSGLTIVDAGGEVIAYPSPNYPWGGSNSMRVRSKSAAGYALLDLGAAVQACRVSFAIRTETIPSQGWGAGVLSVRDGSNSEVFNLDEGRNWSNVRILESGLAGASITIADATQYWLAVFFADAQITARLYSTGHVQVGSDIVLALGVNAVRYFRVGKWASDQYDLDYFVDDLVWDSVSGDSPILGWATGASGQPMAKRWGGIPNNALGAKGRW